MNSLSIFIWLTQICSALHDFLKPIIIIVTTMLITLLVVLSMICADSGKSFNIDLAKYWIKKYTWFIFPAFICLMVVPSQQTMLLIASSELGEKLMNSEQVQSIVNPGTDLLKLWIADETLKLKNDMATQLKK